MNFFNRMKMFGFLFTICECNRAKKTAAHLIMHCERFIKCKDKFKNLHTKQIDIKTLIKKFENT